MKQYSPDIPTDPFSALNYTNGIVCSVKCGIDTTYDLRPDREKFLDEEKLLDGKKMSDKEKLPDRKTPSDGKKLSDGERLSDRGKLR